MNATQTTVPKVCTTCTRATHEALRAQGLDAFRAATTLIGYAPNGGGGLMELRNHPACGSTLVGDEGELDVDDEEVAS